MPKVKIPRKSTNIDMTAMCDVAFLLLTFFMLATKFKPEDPVEIKTPSSVSSKIVPDKDLLLISFDKDGKVYLQMDNPVQKGKVLAIINDTKNLGLNQDQMNVFVNSASIGVSFSKLSRLLSLDPELYKAVKQEGIPVDSTNNELDIWLKSVLSVYQGQNLNILLKGDNNANYKNFKNVIEVFKKNDQLKFQLITAPEDAPLGTALWNTRNENRSAEIK